MTGLDIEIEFMATLYRSVLDKGREPDLDEFETKELDDALDKWAKEDEEFLDAYEQRNISSAWEEVTLHDK